MLPVSVRTSFEGVGEVCLSVPSVVGRAGVLGQVPVPLDEAERADLHASAVALRSVIDSVAS